MGTCVCVWVEGGGVERVTYGLAERACVGSVCGHRGDLRDSQPVQLSWMGDTTQPIHGACVPSGESKRGEKEGRTYFLCFKKNTQVVQMSKYVSMPDDEMLKHEAYWTTVKLQVQKTELRIWSGAMVHNCESITITTTLMSTNMILNSALSLFCQTDRNGNKSLSNTSQRERRLYTQEKKCSQTNVSETEVATAIRELCCWESQVVEQLWLVLREREKGLLCSGGGSTVCSPIYTLTFCLS